MHRSFEELAAWCVRENPVPAGTVLLTGTGVVPPDDVALAPGYRVEVEVEGIGVLANPVRAASDRVRFSDFSSRNAHCCWLVAPP